MHNCPKCGKTSQEFLENICVKCYSSENSLIEAFKEMKIESCSECHRFKHNGKYLKTDIIKIIKDKIIFSKNAKIEKFNAKLHEKEIHITVKGKFESKKKTEKYVIPYINQSLTCKSCGKKGTQYFEGILQIRSNNVDNRIKAHKFIINKLNKQTKVFCNKMVSLKNGFDYFLTDKNYVQELARKTFEEFGIELKINAQLFSRNKQTSKDLYRVNALVKLPDFTKNDIIQVEDMILQVVSIKGKKIIGIDLKSQKKVKFEITKYELINYDTFNTEIIQDKPTTKILHPKTFQPIEISTNKKIGQKVEIVLINDKVYILN